MTDQDYDPIIFEGKSHGGLQAMSDWTAVLQGMKLLTDSGQGLLELLGRVRSHVQDEKLQETIRQQMEEFERIKICADLTLAQGFGYVLCRCTFPPSICKKVGLDEHGLNALSAINSTPSGHDPAFLQRDVAMGTG